MTMVAKFDGEWTEVPDDDEKVLDRYSAAVPMVWAPEYLGAPPEFSWVPLYDEDGRGSFEEQPVEQEPGELEQLAGRTANSLKSARRGSNPRPAPLEELVAAAVRAHLADEYTLTGSLHDWFEDGCGSNCRALAEKDVRAAAEKLRRTITRITNEVIAEMTKEVAA